MRTWPFLVFPIFGPSAFVAALAVALPNAQDKKEAIDVAPLQVAIARLDERVNALSNLLNEREKQVGLALSAAEKATEKAAQAQQRINEASNEWRAALNDATVRNVSRAEYDRAVDRIGSLETGAAGGAGRLGGIDAAQAMIFAVIGVAIGAVGLWAGLRKKAEPERRAP